MKICFETLPGSHPRRDRVCMSSQHDICIWIALFRVNCQSNCQLHWIFFIKARLRCGIWQTVWLCHIIILSKSHLQSHYSWWGTADADIKKPPGGNPGPGCNMTTSQPIYCQGGKTSTSFVQRSPYYALTSQIGWQLLPCNPSMG